MCVEMEETKLRWREGGGQCPHSRILHSPLPTSYQRSEADRMKLFYKILLTTNLHLVTQSIKVLRNTNHEILKIEGTIKLVELLLLIFVMVTPKVALIKNYLKYNRGRNYISNQFLRLFLGLIIRE